MANSIALSKNYTKLLDEVYKYSSVTSDLNTDASLIKAGKNANEIMIPKITMDGLKDYSRNSGYVKGSVSLTYETKKFNYDRGTKFEVDYLDNEESAEVAFGQLAGEFQRTRVAPEADAFTFATLAGSTGISTATAATLDAGEEVVAALRAGISTMDDDEVAKEGRILYITSTLLGLVEDLDTTKSRKVLDKFSKIVTVPQSRFYTAIDLKDGTSSGEELGHYAKATGGKNINFMIVEKSAVIKHDKHKANDIITPEANQDADAYMQKYRKYGIVDVYENKVAGIYLHNDVA